MITIPTISQLYTDILSDLESKLGPKPVFGKVFLVALAAVQAAKLKLLYIYLGNIQRNTFPDNADPASKGGTLERWGEVKLNRQPYSATAAKYVADVTGTIAAIIPAKTTFKSDDDTLNSGKLFILDAEYTFTGSSGQVTLRALDAGLASKLEIGDTLTATAPIANVDKIATVDSVDTEPVAAETIEDYRAATIQSFRLEPQGGAGSDYRVWSESAEGLKQVYPYAVSGQSGIINLYVEANTADSTDGKGTPTAQLLTDVETLIETDARPIGILQINYLAVTIKEIDIEIVGYVGATAAIQATILSALTEAINKVRPFISSTDDPVTQNDSLDINKIISVILTAKPGSIFSSVVLKVDTVSQTSFTFENGDIPNLDSVTYT